MIEILPLIKICGTTRCILLKVLKLLSMMLRVKHNGKKLMMFGNRDEKIIKNYEAFSIMRVKTLPCLGTRDSSLPNHHYPFVL